MEHIASARFRIDFMIFGWGDDPAGRPVAAALIEHARAGVLVHLFLRDLAASEELHALLPLPRGWLLLRGRWEIY